MVVSIEPMLVDVQVDINWLLTLLQSPQPAGGLSRHDLACLVKAILALENYILDFENSFASNNVSFYSSLVALSANAIIGNASILPKSYILTASNSSFVLMQYLLHAVQTYTEQSVLSKLQLINLIQGLCDEVTPLVQLDFMPLIAALKSSRIPDELKVFQPQTPTSCQPFTRSPSVSSDETEKETSNKKLRVDQSCESLLEQLMTPLMDPNKKSPGEGLFPSLGSTEFPLAPSPSDVKSALLAKNLANLQLIGGANSLLDFAMSLGTIAPYVQLVAAGEEGAPLKLPSTLQDAMATLRSTKQLSKDFDIVSRILSLPILHPLREDLLSKILTLIHASLYISVSLVTASSISSIVAMKSTSSCSTTTTTISVLHREDSYEESTGEPLNPQIYEIIDTSLDIYRRIMQMMKKSLRVGSQVWQNSQLFACWLLLSGLKFILQLNPAKILGNKESISSTINYSPKVRQGYTIQCIPLANLGIMTLNSLLSDLKNESGVDQSISLRMERLQSSSNSTCLKYNKFGCYSAWQRIEMLLSGLPLSSLLFSLGSASYRKAGVLRISRILHSQPHHAPIPLTPVSSVSSNEHVIDLMRTPSVGGHAGQSDIEEECCFSSDDSSRDEDSEPMLGQLFRESERSEFDREDGAKGGLIGSRTPHSPDYSSFGSAAGHSEKRDPHRHLTLSHLVFDCINNNFVCTDVEPLKLYLKSTLTEAQIIVLTNIVKDLDRDGTTPCNTGFYLDFSKSLTSFIHNLIATNTLSDGLQVSLLTNLGVNPSPSPNSCWPLYIPPRTLSIMAQILLLKQRREKNELRSDTGTACMAIWQSLIYHLKKLVLDPNASSTTVTTTSTCEAEKPQSRFSNCSEGIGDCPDINVEHAQVLLFIFHNLKLLQRKQLLLTLTQTIVEVSDVVNGRMRDEQIHYLSRLLHFFEYMMKNIYEPPTSLIEQINHNLLHQSNNEREKDKETTAETPAAASASSTTTATGITAVSASAAGKMYFHSREIEENYLKYCCLNPDEDRLFTNTIKPRFYHLINIDMPFSLKEPPKFDSMAINFLLGGSNSVANYNQLYDSLIKILTVSNQLDGFTNQSDSPALSFFGICATQYCFGVAWRLMMQLPPSVKSLETLSKCNNFSQPQDILHAVVWVPRICENKWYCSWIKEMLTKMIQPSAPDYDVEKLLSSLLAFTSPLGYSVSLLSNFFNNVKSNYKDAKQLPSLFNLMAIEALAIKTFGAIENAFSSSASTISEASPSGDEDAPVTPKVITSSDARDAVKQILPATVDLILLCYKFIRMSILLQAQSEDPQSELTGPGCKLLQLAAGKMGKVNSYSLSIASLLPKSLKKAAERWNCIPVDLVPLKNDLSSSETLIQGVQAFHFSCLLSNPFFDDDSFNVNINLKHTSNTLIKFAEELFLYSFSDEYANANVEDRVNISELIIPLHLDLSLDSFSAYGLQAVEATYGSKESDEFLLLLHLEALTHGYDLIVNHPKQVDDAILIETLKFMEQLLTFEVGQLTLEKFFCDGESDLVSMFMSASDEKYSSAFSGRVLKFFAKLFEQADRNPDVISLVRLCTSLTKLNRYSQDPQVLVAWLNKVLFPVKAASNGASSSTSEEVDLVTATENRIVLHQLASFIVKESSMVEEEVATMFLAALVKMGSQILTSSPEALDFSDLFAIMNTMASAGSGNGHLTLIRYTSEWLEKCTRYLSSKDVMEKFESDVTTGKHYTMLDSTHCMLTYLSEIYDALKLLSNNESSVLVTSTTEPGRTSPTAMDTLVGEVDPEIDSDWLDELSAAEEDDSNDDESDDDSLSNKLCTFTTTQKEFINQHWYHCHTCKMTDRVGMCTICAKVCHKDHDVTYSKYGSFFCDCGAREDGSCQALVRRPPEQVTNVNSSARPSDANQSNLSTAACAGAGARCNISPDTIEGSKSDQVVTKSLSLARQLSPIKSEVLQLIQSKGNSMSTLSLLEYLSPVITSNCQKNSVIGASTRAKSAINDLHSLNKRLESSETLMVPTLGSQEGAFENVKINFTGDQGQLIRQLLQSHIIHRVAMCALTSPFGKRQHLAVCHEKGKITLLQLSVLLKQADSSRKKLTLTRLAVAPVPFTALSASANPINEDLLAVCGLKDCHVLTFSKTGSVLGHLVLQLQLESSNYVIKCQWLPGSQTELCVITSDFIKVFDLSVSISNPQYFFLPPSGKVRDVTYIVNAPASRTVLMITTSGHIYSQPLNQESSHQHGPFYITNMIEVKNSDITESAGVSIYYSHTFKLLFVSYSNGKAFAAPVTESTSEITSIFMLEIRSQTTQAATSPSSPSVSYSNNSTTKSVTTPTSSSSLPQILCNWTEVPGHPGLIFAMSQQSNNPFVFMVKPDTVVYQEIKSTSPKAKITDMVALRHSTNSGDMRTTLILLCEDGSLRIYMANQETTNYWLNPGLNASPLLFSPQDSTSKSHKRKKSKTKQLSTSVTAPNSSGGETRFPVDFFEHCTPLTDVDFGGNDVLQIYNSQQLKNRLNSSGLYIASTKANGFSIEVFNNDSSVVMVGIRILVGSQDPQRVPSYIEMFGRSIPVYGSRVRWYDVPFTREESLTADRKMVINFGPSSDPNNVIMVDSIKVYGKSKESFSWPDDEGDEIPSGSMPPNSNGTEPSESFGSLKLHQLHHLDRFLASALKVLDGFFTHSGSARFDDEKREVTLHIVTSLLTHPFPVPVQQNIKSILMTLHSSKLTYHNHKDAAVLNFVINTLVSAYGRNELDGESFHRLLTATRSIAVWRPYNLIKISDYMTSSLTSTSKKSLEIEIKPIDAVSSSSDARPSQISQSCNELFSERNTLPTLSPPPLPQRSVSFSETTKFSSASNFVSHLSDVFWKLYQFIPENPLLASIPNIGLVHLESTVSALVDIVHAFSLADSSNIQLASQLYLKLLLCENSTISFAAKQSIIRVLRPKSRKLKTISSVPSEDSTKMQMTPTHHLERVMTHDSLEGMMNENVRMFQSMEASESLEMEGPGVEDADELLAAHPGAAQLAQMMELSGNDDADDEAMVELAIALSLQNQDVSAAGGVVDAPVIVLDENGQPTVPVPGNVIDAMSDTTASDDEGSTAATDGSTLRTSPVATEPGPGVAEPESESGGSPPESVIGEHVPSGRSSAYGEDAAPATQATVGQRHALGSTTESVESTCSTAAKFHSIRLSILEKLIESLTEVRNVGGIRCIPVMQVILMLSSDLDTDSERDHQVFSMLLSTLLRELDEASTHSSQMVVRAPEHEVKLIIMRLLSILMSRVKSSSSSKSTSETPASFSSLIAKAMVNSNLHDLCLQILVTLLDYWREMHAESERTTSNGNGGNIVSNNLLRNHILTPPPDMSPFFLKQYVKGHADDVFELYPQLLSEMVLRLPYQIRKICNSLLGGKGVTFSTLWSDTLCEYMMLPLTPYVKRQVRKLLSYICGSKDSYRQVRDFHVLESRLREIKKICFSGGYVEPSKVHSPGNIIISLSYDATISLIEQLRMCSEVASSRTNNWQKYCSKDKTVLPFLLQISSLLDEGVSTIILQLINVATTTCSNKASSSKVTGEKAQTDQGAENSDSVSTYSEANLNIRLSHELVERINQSQLLAFLRCFLLESNSTALRWQAHALIYSLHENLDDAKGRSFLIDTLWLLWPKVSCYGLKSAQFVDLLGYFALKSPVTSDRCKAFAEKSLSVLRQQNQLLQNHTNAHIYRTLQTLVEFDGYYLESEPCLVCNNPEVNFSQVKLSSLKVDSRFTTTTQIVKLVSSHTIAKINLRISDIKRSKMVKTLAIYYNNRAVHSVVELRNKPLWHKAKKCSLSPGQAEVKIDFPLPIIACNLMIEYTDFYENIQASSETLQCPRCSASVPATPGVCGNCGENVFQCHKCRAINYDEKDPFLCNSCGFCKYAKFDFSLTCRPTCAVDPIENEEDRKKSVSTINNLLEKADRVYKNLMATKPALEMLLLRVQENGFIEKLPDDLNNSGPLTGHPGGISNVSVHVNRAIQQIAYKYCNECKSQFDELSKIIQRVLASRKELVDYDNKQRERYSSGIQGNGMPVATSASTSSSSSVAPGSRRDSKVMASLSSASGRCYGCASATVEQCITLLKALASNSTYKSIFCSSGLIAELMDYNLRTGTSNHREDVRQLLCTLTKDNVPATLELNNRIANKINNALTAKANRELDFSTTVRSEIALLVTSLEREDSCWELNLRCLMQIFLRCINEESPLILETITLPSLRLLISLIKPDPHRSRRNRDKTLDQISTVRSTGFNVKVDLNSWLNNDATHSFSAWKKRSQKLTSVTPAFNKMSKQEVHVYYLKQKFANKWREKTLTKSYRLFELDLQKDNWLRQICFNRFSRTVRFISCSLIEALFQVPSRSKEIIDMLASCLDDLGSAGESGAEFFSLFKTLVRQDHWKYYLALKGILLHLGSLINREIEVLNELEETTLNTDLSEGSALKMLVDLLTIFVEVGPIRRQYKTRLVAFVLNGYLSLRKLIVQRTKIIDETQETLLELLEEMTTGTETETEQFMNICIDAVNRCKSDDMRTPVFIFEQLCSVIYPEESSTSEFYITLEKDSQQEDFLQGRMVGNPYSSNDPGLGPLMRDIKNKICTDCELVALLEDDSGMELLVNNKIISLDLPVKDVFKKVWCAENSETEAMRIIYRMRGLMGDATEEFIESLDSKDSTEIDNEVVFKMANRMAVNGGIEVMLEKLDHITNLSPQYKSLFLVLLKLFSHCVKVKSCRQKLIDPSLKAIPSLLSALRMAIKEENNELNVILAITPGQPDILQQLLTLIEVICVEASNESTTLYNSFSEDCGGTLDILFLLSAVDTISAIKNNQTVLHLLMRVLSFLTLGNMEKMQCILDHFRNSLNFKKFDFDHTQEDAFKIDCFCILVNSIEKNHNGDRLKDLILSQSNVISDALEYITIHAPTVKSALLATSEEWKEFTQRPALKHVLRILTGLSSCHEQIQLLVSGDIIPVLHGLEQVSSDSHVGSLAESLLEELKQNVTVAAKIEEVRKQTRDEKKRLAMAVRQKQLGQLGMTTNERGQVTASATHLVEDLGEEQGLTCIICREGYKFQPTKVLGIYTYTKRCVMEPYEGLGPSSSGAPKGGRKAMGYSTVTHFNIVHVDCHMAAVRHARGRDEWESAALQNANTKCNGLIPLWGSQVQESAFASCLARHNTYLQEATGHRDINYNMTIHDLRLLLLKFANEESFSTDSGGGGPQSNVHLIPYLIHMALYVINTTRSASRESRKCLSFLEQQSTNKIIESCFEAEGVNYYACLFLVVNSISSWQSKKVTFLRRLLLQAQIRSGTSDSRGATGGSASTSIDPNVKNYSVYKSSLIFYALIDGIYTILFKVSYFAGHLVIC